MIENSNRLNILLLAPYYSSHIRNWSEILCGHSVTILCAFSGTVNGTQVPWLPFRGRKGYILNSPAVVAYCFLNKFDLLHGHYAAGNGLLLMLIPHKYKVLSVWGSDIFSDRGSFLKRRWVLQRILSSPKALVCTSEWLKGKVQSMYNVRRPIFQIPFGIKISKFDDSVLDKPPSVILGIVKSIEPIYGIDLAINGLEEYLKSGRQARLEIYGDGSDMEVLKEVVSKKDLESNITFHGKIPYSQIENAYNSFNILLNLSRSESFGVAVLEAGASRIPCIASSIEGLKETVVDGVTGFLVNHYSPQSIAKAITCLSCTQTRIDFGEKAYQYVANNFSNARVRLSINELYTQILND